MVDPWAVFGASGNGGGNASSRTRESSGSSSSEFPTSPSALPLPPRLQPLDEELSFGRFGASPGPGASPVFSPGVGGSTNSNANANANGSGSGNVNMNDTRLSAWRMLDSGISGSNTGVSGGQSGLPAQDGASSTVPRLQRPSLPPLGLEAMYEAGGCSS
jgi:hypothetical protein